MTAHELPPDGHQDNMTARTVEAESDVPVVSATQVLFGNRWALLADLLLPFAVYQILTGRGISAAAALSATAFFPLAHTAAGWLRNRRLDTLGIISLVFIVAGLLATFITGNPRLMLMKGSVLTGSFGLAFLVSLLLPHPLAFYLGRQMMTGGKAKLIARWDAHWEYAQFRAGNRVVSTVWGCGLMVEALLRIVLTLSLTISTFLLVWTVISYGIYAALLFWTVSYARR